MSRDTPSDTPGDTLTRRGFLSGRGRRRPQSLDSSLSRERLESLAVPEESRMMGWMSLRRQMLKAFALDDAERLSLYVAKSCRSELELTRLYGVTLPDERPSIELVRADHLAPGSALYTVRERSASALSEVLFAVPCRLEIDLQVTAGTDWLVRAIRPLPL